MDPNGLRHGVPDRAGKDPARECGKYRQLHHLGIFGRKERGENPQLDTVWCATTLGLGWLPDKNKQEKKYSNNNRLPKF